MVAMAIDAALERLIAAKSTQRIRRAGRANGDLSNGAGVDIDVSKLIISRQSERTSAPGGAAAADLRSLAATSAG
jgi:hypothetical protein